MKARYFYPLPSQLSAYPQALPQSMMDKMEKYQKDPQGSFCTQETVAWKGSKLDAVKIQL